MYLPPARRADTKASVCPAAAPECSAGISAVTVCTHAGSTSPACAATHSARMSMTSTSERADCHVLLPRAPCCTPAAVLPQSFARFRYCGLLCCHGAVFGCQVIMPRSCGHQLRHIGPSAEH